MKTTLYTIILSISATAFPAVAQQLPPSAEVMGATENVAAYFIDKYPDVGAQSNVGGKRRSSRIWTRSVFYEGLLNAWRENPREDWLRYATDWGEFHKWKSSTDTEAKRHNADFQCCGQAYLQLYKLEPAEEKMEHIKMRIDNMMDTGADNYWYWVDAVQMAMPVMALLGDITGDESYWESMHSLYAFTRDKQGGEKRGGGSPLKNAETGLWYRDYKFDPPYRDLAEPDRDCYWSRGNGWMAMALTRVLQFTPDTEKYRAEYIADFRDLCAGLAVRQNPKGWWNVSLDAPSNFGSAGSEGPEMTGTSLFVGAMAWGLREGLLDENVYLPAVCQGWQAMKAAVHPDGFVGYLQGTGSAPEHGGPITYDSMPDFEDFGIGCWLWGASEVHALCKSRETSDIADPVADRITDGTIASDRDGMLYDLMGRRVDKPVPGSLYIRNHRLVIAR